MHSSGCIGAGELADLASRGARRVANLPAASMERLHAELVPGPEADAGCVSAQLEFQHGNEGFPQLLMTLSGTLPLECQRCLAPMSWTLDLTVRLTVVEAEAELERVSEPMDAIVMDEGWLDIDRAIEDEALAALPMIPAHEPDECNGIGLVQRSQQSPTTRPFAELGAMLKKRSGTGSES